LSILGAQATDWHCDFNSKPATTAKAVPAKIKCSAIRSRT
jgi:hypothetical protein